jgi:hypothetical protein
MMYDVLRRVTVKKSKRFLGIAALGLAFTLGLATSAYTQEHEHHPAIHEAQHFLSQALDSLEQAKRDFGGHRVKAMEHIRAAQSELHEALDFDRE